MKFLYRLFQIGYRIQQWLLRRFTTPGLACLICLVITAVIGIDTKQTTTYQVLAFLLSMLLMAVLFSLYFPERFAVERKLPRYATVGSRLIYSIIITNNNRRTQMGLLLLEEITHPKLSLAEFKQTVKAASQKNSWKSLSYIYYYWLKTVSRKRKAKSKAIALPALKPCSETEIRAELTPTHRGVVRLTGITILRPDPFNLFNAAKTIKQRRSLLVLPKRYQLPAIELPGSRLSQSSSISLADLVGDSEEFVALRDYRPGDPWRKIHWKSWAKTGKPVIREEQNEYFVRQALILDTFQTEVSDKLEEAVSVAASFAWDLRTQESLLDLMFVGLESYSFTSGRSLGSSQQMLEVLAGIVPCRDRTFDCLTAVVMQKLSLLSGCICVLIGWDEQRQKLIDYLRGYDIPLLVLLVTENESVNLNRENIHILPVGKIQQALMNLG